MWLSQVEQLVDVQRSVLDEAVFGSTVHAVTFVARGKQQLMGAVALAKRTFRIRQSNRITRVIYRRWM
ncbi:MAG: hypothetical protein QGF59_10365 [Pirellulaceae bacterium]|nr:hypothetical protein [Pirellulaceae bacterium]